MSSASSGRPVSARAVRYTIGESWRKIASKSWTSGCRLTSATAFMGMLGSGLGPERTWVEPVTAGLNSGASKGRRATGSILMGAGGICSSIRPWSLDGVDHEVLARHLNRFEPQSQLLFERLED